MILGAAMLALATVGCENEPIVEDNTPVTPDEPIVEEPTEPTELVLRANLPATRTVLNDDFSVSWNDGDGITVFQAEAGQTPAEWTNYKFDIDSEKKGVFSPAEGVEVPFEDGKNYDWYVMYPYTETITAPKAIDDNGDNKSDTGYFPIGAQTQTGYNSTAHIASADLLVGKALDTREPAMTLKHLAVLHKFTVTNDSDKPTVITKLSLNGGDNKLFGTFWIDLTAEVPAIDIEKANGTFNERALTVKEGTELAVGESADFYMITAPFTLNSGETLKMTIETSTGTQVVEKTATSDIEFKAGTYNTASLVYNYKPVYADHLYSEIWDTTQTISGTSAYDTASHEGNLSSSVKTEFVPAKLTNYNNEGTSVYDGVIKSLTYTSDGTNTCLSKNTLTGLNGTYVWFRKNTKGWLQIDGIKLHGKTALTLSYLQQGTNGKVKVEYSVDGTNWTTLHEAANVTAQQTKDFTVEAGCETISLRFSENGGSNHSRIDEIKLTWQE